MLEELKIQLRRKQGSGLYKAKALSITRQLITHQFGSFYCRVEIRVVA